ncbi:SDR family oxidoreductase [Leifsonia sp. 21MFCrub1.1]|uniref:SDR family oxidoreductase n=1 Tax=Leifsonia sp. 21MFCrub1.1 TaxID=1798223 RepID=UPI000B7DDAEA
MPTTTGTHGRTGWASRGEATSRVEEFVEYLACRTTELQPLRRAGRSHNIAQAVLFLASEEWAWISGIVVPVDGGATAVGLGGGAPIRLPGTGPVVRQVANEFLASSRILQAGRRESRPTTPGSVLSGSSLRVRCYCFNVATSGRNM